MHTRTKRATDGRAKKLANQDARLHRQISYERTVVAAAQGNPASPVTPAPNDWRVPIESSFKCGRGACLAAAGAVLVNLMLGWLVSVKCVKKVRKGLACM